MARPRLGESDTERLHMKITKDELADIDAWRYANHIPSRSEAVRRLTQIGLFLDSEADRIAKQALDLDQSFSDRFEAASKQLVDGDGEPSDKKDAFISDMFRFAIDMYEKTEYLIQHIGIVLGPMQALKKSGRYNDARWAALSKKAETTREFLELKLAMFEVKKSHKLLPRLPDSPEDKPK
jgi:hypothetical protein